MQTKLPEAKLYKVQILKKNTGWQDAYHDYPQNKNPMVFDDKGKATSAKLRKFGLGPHTRIVTPNGRKFIL